MKDEKTKFSELTVNENGIRIRHANPNPMSAQQKYNIIMLVISMIAACVLVLGFFSLLQ